MGRLHLQARDYGEKPDWWTTDEWSTPPAFVAGLVRRFGSIDLDPCCRPETARGARYFTRADNGLVQPWDGLVFVNPPYSEPKVWVEKAISESRRTSTCRVIMLLPASVDTGWFHDLVLPNADIEFMRGRLRFHGWHGIPVGSPTAGNLLGFFPKGWKNSAPLRVG